MPGEVIAPAVCLAAVRVRAPSQRWSLPWGSWGSIRQGGSLEKRWTIGIRENLLGVGFLGLSFGRTDSVSCCAAANSTGMVGYDFGAQSAFVSVGADTDVSGKEVQAR